MTEKADGIAECTAAWATVVGRPRIEQRPGVTNAIWHVGANDGRTYVLKQLPEYPPGLSHIQEYRVLQHLHANGIPVTVPVVTDDGRICAHYGGHNFTLLPELPADAADRSAAPRTQETCLAVGAAIADLVTKLATCPWPIDSFTESMRIELDSPSMPVDIVDRITPRLRRHVEQSLTDLPRQRVHGDCNTGNVLIHKGQVSGILDLDHLPMAPRIYDIVYYSVFRLQDLLGQPHGEEQVLDAFVPELDGYLAGFRSNVVLNEGETAAIMPGMLAIAANLAEWHRRPDGYDAKYRRNTAAALWLCDHLETVT